MPVLKKLWKAWLRVAEKIGNFQGRVLFSIIYFLMAGPIAIIMKLFADPLAIKRHPKSLRPARGNPPTNLDSARRQ